MSFTIQISKNNLGDLIEVASFTLRQRITYHDGTRISEKIFPELKPLKMTAKAIRQSQIYFKQREDKTVFYQGKLLNEFGGGAEQPVPTDFYFQFQPPLNSNLQLRQIEKIDYSIVQNFSKILTNKTFQKDLKFQKITDVDFDFFVQSEAGYKYYPKTLIPFSINPPQDTKRIVQHSVRCENLSTGFYKIDQVNYFFDQLEEIIPNHYIIKLSV